MTSFPHPARRTGRAEPGAWAVEIQRGPGFLMRGHAAIGRLTRDLHNVKVVS